MPAAWERSGGDGGHTALRRWRRGKGEHMFARDRDLLALEPNLFRDVGWLAQRLVKGVGSVAAGTLALSTQDVNFEAAGVDAGHVVLVGNVGEAAPYEVLARLSTTEVSISRLRAGGDSPQILPSPATSVPVEVWTFVPQMALAHAQVLRMVGIEAGSEGESPSASDIVNVGAVRAVEAIAALYLVFSAAAGPQGAGSHAGARAEHYRRLYVLERQRTPVLLDVDGDGQVDATRRFNVVQFIR